jgi:hypothetical protein
LYPNSGVCIQVSVNSEGKVVGLGVDLDEDGVDDEWRVVNYRMAMSVMKKKNQKVEDESDDDEEEAQGTPSSAPSCPSCDPSS